MNLDPEIWGPDSEIFNPDRWDNLPKSVTNYSYLTFLQGSSHSVLTYDRSEELYCTTICRDRDEVFVGRSSKEICV